VPTSCPDPRVLVAKEQECMLPQCSAGMQRVDDKIHCCWPGQGWSVTRQVCVGIAQCPAHFEAEGDGCVSDDKDGDGIPNSRDKCPDEAEDKNGFEDEDGCPDEDRRVAAAAALENQRAAAEAAKKAEAEAAAKQEADRQAKAEAERQAQIRAEKQRQEDAARAEQDRLDSIEAAHTRRTWGFVVTGAGLASGIASFVFMGLGAGVNGSIRGGSLSNGQAISNAASAGQSDNTMAIVFGTVGIVGCAVGVPLVISGLGSSEADSPKSAGAPLRSYVSVSPMPHGGGILGTIVFR
jgi:hypothetical protein